MSRHSYFLVILAFLSLVFTNCQQAGDEMTQELEAIDRQIVDASIFENFSPDASQSEFPAPVSAIFPKENQLIQQLEHWKETAESRTRRSRTKTRDYDSSSASSVSASSETRAEEEYRKAILKCNAPARMGSTKSTIYVNEKNQYDNADFYTDFGLNPDLNGLDESFYLDIKKEQMVTIYLRNARENLAMLLFKANITPGTDQISEESEKLVAFSTSYSRVSEQLGPTRLAPGQYLLIVDSRPNRGSDFTLKLHCEDIHDNCNNSGGSTLISDDIESYRESNLSPQTVYWEKWDPDTGSDGQVIDKYSNDQDIKFEARNGKPANLLLCLGERTAGFYQLRFSLGFPRGGKGHLNIQKILTLPDEENEVGAHINFKGNGIGEIIVKNRKTNFNYRDGFWMNARFDFDLDRKRTAFYLNGRKISSWDGTATVNSSGGTNQIEALNFVAWDKHYAFLVDNICFSTH